MQFEAMAHVVSCVTKDPKFRPMMTCQLGSHRASKCFLIFSAAANPERGEPTSLDGQVNNSGAPVRRWYLEKKHGSSSPTKRPAGCGNCVPKGAKRELLGAGKSEKTSPCIIYHTVHSVALHGLHEKYGRDSRSVGRSF